MEKVKMNCNMRSTLPFFLAGLGTGVACALLLAPLSGVATRSLISRKVKNGEEWMKDTAATAKDYVTTQATGLREGFKEAVEVIGRS